jgi:hypothetical protein
MPLVPLHRGFDRLSERIALHLYPERQSAQPVLAGCEAGDRTHSQEIFVGIRANTEGSCACAGDGDAAVGVIHYSEQGTGRREEIRPFVKGSANTSPLRRIKLTRDKADAPNLQQFPVTPGVGYVAFMNGANKNLNAANVWFRTSRRNLGTQSQTGMDTSCWRYRRA